MFLKTRKPENFEITICRIHYYVIHNFFSKIAMSAYMAALIVRMMESEKDASKRA